MPRRLLWLLVAALCLAASFAAFAIFIERQQAWLAAPQLLEDAARLPSLEVGLVLGTQPLTTFRSGRSVPNIPFVHRLDTAAALWRSGKVKFLLVSGKRDGSYDEPKAMRAWLIARGVPAAAIYQDGEGWRTLDSIRRAREVFGLRQIVIVSQRAHVERAMFLARAAGIDAWGLAAPDEGSGVPTWAARFTLVAVALRAWWDVQTGVGARAGPPAHLRIGVDSPN